MWYTTKYKKRLERKYFMRTRFAYNPRKPFDIPDLRDALFSYLIAKHEGGEFILRIEDCNQENYDFDNEENLYKLLDLFHLVYDEGPKKEKEGNSYIQSERLELYKKYAEKLIRKGVAYYCFCSKEELNYKRLDATSKKETYQYDKTHRNFPKDEAMRKIELGEKYVIRFAIPISEGQTSFHDLVYGDITTPNSSLEDNILIKSNGIPTYNFASVLDDTLMNIDIAIRNNAFLSSTPKYIKLYESLGMSVPDFLHLPSIVGLNEKGDTLTDLLEQGFLPEAILNYVAFLGWSPKTNQEFFSLEELIRIFDYKNIVKRPAHFELAKLKWYNHHYIMKMSEEQYLKWIRPFLEKFYNLEGYSEDWIKELLLAYKNKISFGTEIVYFVHSFFVDLIELNENAVTYLKGEESIPNTLLQFKEAVKNCTVWTKEGIQNMLEDLKEKCSVSKDLVYMPIRVSLTGTKIGINLVDTLYLLGKEKILNRMEEII